MADFTVHFYDEAPEGARQKYAVIIARYQGRLLWCRHQARDTWEVPGGHIEAGESALEAAARELQEETGATDYTLTPVCWYRMPWANSAAKSLKYVRSTACRNSSPIRPSSLFFFRRSFGAARYKSRGTPPWGSP